MQVSFLEERLKFDACSLILKLLLPLSLLVSLNIRDGIHEVIGLLIKNNQMI